MSRTLIFLFLISGLTSGQSRIEFHLLPAVSTGPLSPSWSPDGKSLVFSMRGDIWLLPAEGGAAKALTQGPAYHFEPTISPDGSKVALSLDIDGNLEIGIIDISGGEVERLTYDSEIDIEPIWSPDGKGIYFVSRRNGNLDIFHLDLKSKHITAIVASNKNEFQPAISSDGCCLAYISSVKGKIGSGGIWMMPLPFGEPRLVHYEETSFRAKPQWSPNGSVLFYSSDVAGSNDIAIVPIKGGNPLKLTYDLFDEFDISISPDGSNVAFVSNHEGPTRLYMLSSSGGTRNDWKPIKINSRHPRYKTGRVRGVVRDQGGNVIPARLMLSASDGRAYTEDMGFHRMTWSTRTHYQHVKGSFDIEVPAGIVNIEAMRGFEYLPSKVNIDVPSDAIVQVELELKRLIDAPMNGWYSGDTHTHDLHEGRFGLTQKKFFNQLVADDIHVTNALIHMDGTKLMGRLQDLTGKPYMLSTQNHILQYAQEFRGSFGHVALLGLKKFIMPLIGGTANTPFASDVLKIRYIDGVHEQGGIAGFVHPYNHLVQTPYDAASTDIPVHVALEKGDFYDIVSVASREIDSAKIYYKLLNAGFRISATGGTDNFSDVWADPSGGTARTYVHLNESLNFNDWISAVKAGHTFATNGPLLFLNVEGHKPGEEIHLTNRDSIFLSVRAEVASISPLDSIQIFANGEILHTWRLSTSGPIWSLKTSIKMPGSGWILARAMGPQSHYLGDAFAFAQTSPVYVIKDSTLFSSAEDAKFLLETIDELWKRVKKRNTWTDEISKFVYHDSIEQARLVYQKIILKHPENQLFRVPAPDTSRVLLKTNKGDIIIDLFREWSPNGVDRFYNMVRYGFYNNNRFFRVREKGFVQFGIHSEPEIAKLWRHKSIMDDPVIKSNKRGRIAFAMGYDPNDRTTQIYINLKDKPELDKINFAPIGEVIVGMNIADSIYSGYGELAGGGIRGGKQDSLFENGNQYLDKYFPKLDFIIEARLIENYD